MRGFILVGGLGTRLRTIGITRPKPMIEINGRPFLEYLIRNLRRNKITEIVLCVGFGAEIVQNHFRDGNRLGVKIFYSNEEMPLGTGGAIKNAEEFAVDENIILNGDSYLELNYGAMLAFHRQKEALATIACTPVEMTGDYGSIRLTETQQILDFSEKVDSGTNGLINGGVYIFGKEAFSHIPAQQKVSIEEETFPELVKTQKCFAWKTRGYFLDIGTPERLSRARIELPDFFESQDL